MGKDQCCEFSNPKHDSDMTPKQKSLKTLATLPDDSTYEDVQEEVRILAALEDAECDIEAGRIVSHEAVKERLAKWTSS